MNNNMNDITRVGLTANQLKNQFPSMAIKTVAASLQKELPVSKVIEKTRASYINYIAKLSSILGIATGDDDDEELSDYE